MTDSDFELVWGVKIPLRDAVELNATVYQTCSHASGPVIVTLTPYIADSDHARAVWFAQHDYIFVLVDCRGRGNSAGAFEPFVNESRDTCDIVEWLALPTADAYWHSATLTPAEYDRIDIPILSITGHYDDDQPGALHYYRRHMASLSPAKDQHYLIIGPWDHGGTRTPAREFGGLTFGEAAMLDMNRLHGEWYDWIFKDAARPAFLRNRIAYYVMAAEEWKYAASLDAIADESRRFYLDSGESANDVFHSGILSEALPERSAADSYRYDPLDLRPAELEREAPADYLTNQQYALNLFGNGLIYHTPAFEEQLEVSGFLTLTAWITLDVPDTDFQVLLYEILPDGSSILLTQDFLRARYRESLSREKPVTPGAIQYYRFDGFTFFSRLIGKGSRLRLLFKSPNSIYQQKNYNSGGVVTAESAGNARTAQVILHHDAAHASYLELPVVKLSTPIAI